MTTTTTSNNKQAAPAAAGGSNAAPSSSAAVAAEIQRLLQETDGDDRSNVVRLDELRKVFARLIQSGEMSTMMMDDGHDAHSASASGSKDARKMAAVKRKWKSFLLQSHRTFISQLVAAIRRGKPLFIRPLVRTFWGVVASTPRTTAPGKGEGAQIVSAELLVKFVQALTKASSRIALDKGLSHLLSEFLQFHDVQYYLLAAIASHADALCRTKEKAEDDDTATQLAANQMLFELLCLVPVVAGDEDLDDGYLFPPPAAGAPEDQSDDSESSDEEEEEDSDEEESDSDDDDDDDDDDGDAPEPLPKKRKVEPVRRFAFQTVRGHRRALFKAWHAVLRLSLPEHCLKQALILLPKDVLPRVSRPLLFADFFMSAYQHSGVIAVLALDGLFLLMTQHRLEFPDFYKQLYRILKPQLFFVKYRTRFFRLLDKCLRNDLLPAHVVAAFVKRLCRCVMTAPPPAALFVLALSSNLVRRYPGIACLVHRKDDPQTANFVDAFDPTTDDPERANALSSSLWEVQVLEGHYLQQVATLAKSVGRTDELSAPLYNLEDFLGHTYSTLMEGERKPRLARSHNKPSRDGKSPAAAKSATPLTYSEPKGLFVGSDVFAGVLEPNT
jgi:U3 small nucleolar RNA-associated protein 19